MRRRTHGRNGRARVSLATLVGLLIAGGVVGYLLSLPTTERAIPTAARSPITDIERTPVGRPIADSVPYEWVEQNPTDSPLQAWGVFAAVDLNDALYLLVFSNIDAPRDRVLWHSDNGEDWTEIPLDFGDAIVDDLDVFEDTLLLSGWLDGAPALWRSQRYPTTDPTWKATELEAANQPLGQVRFLDSSVQTEISSDGELVVAVRTQSDITPLLLDFVDEPQARSLFQLSEPPVVAAYGHRIWAQVFSDEGLASVHSVELPSTTVLEPASGPYAIDVGLIAWGSLWASPDGSTFAPVDLSSLPRPPVPYALGDSFVAAVEDSRGRYRLWTSPDGTVWSPSEAVPPAECGGWDSLVVGGPGMLVINPFFDTTCVSGNGVDWEVRDSLQAALPTPGQFWTSGTATGYLALTRSSPDMSVLISGDGLEWRPIEFASGLLGTHAFLVDDRLVTNAMTYGPPPQGRRFSVWVGDPTEG